MVIPLLRFAILFVTALVYPLMRFLQWLRLRRKLDPWRRTVGLGLRSEGTKFVLSAFGLNAPADPSDPRTVASLVRTLTTFLRDQPDASIAVVHHRFWVERIRTKQLDLVYGEFDREGALISITVDLDDRFPLNISGADRDRINKILVRIHSETRGLAETVRPRRIWQMVRSRLAIETASRSIDPVARIYAERLLRAWFVSIEPMESRFPGRFAPPDFRKRRNFGSGCVNLVARLNRKTPELDFWLQIHHAGADGASFQELLGRLENHLGTSGEFRFPEADDQRAFSFSCEIVGREPQLSVASEFLSFQSLLRERKRLNEMLREELDGEIPVVALLLWKLVQQPEFHGRRFAIAVDVPKNGEFDRGVDLVSIAPDSRSGAFTESELAEFTRSFLRLVDAARCRATSTYEATRQLAALPSWLAQCALQINRARSGSVFGTVGISVLREAKVFVAPMSDSGFDEGFLALGSLTLPGSHRGCVGCVTFKGPQTRVEPTFAALRRIARVSG